MFSSLNHFCSTRKRRGEERGSFSNRGFEVLTMEGMTLANPARIWSRWTHSWKLLPVDNKLVNVLTRKGHPKARASCWKMINLWGSHLKIHLKVHFFQTWGWALGEVLGMICKNFKLTEPVLNALLITNSYHKPSPTQCSHPCGT